MRKFVVKAGQVAVLPPIRTTNIQWLMDNLKPKKYLGQHFLKDQGIAQRIVDQLSAGPTDEVVEIGPGQGVLTAYLMARYPRLQCVEVDDEAVAYLAQRFTQPALNVIHQDVLTWKVAESLQPDAFFIGNLPYNISSPFFFKLMEVLPYVKEGVFMVQKEVAQRICADKGSKTYGILSVLLGAYFERRYLFSVPPGAFRPPPKVMSGVLKLERKANLPEVSASALKHLVKTAFNQRRKTLRNALKSIPLQEFEQKEAWLQLRAEQLGVEAFLKLAEKMAP